MDVVASTMASSAGSEIAKRMSGNMISRLRVRIESAAKTCPSPPAPTSRATRPPPVATPAQSTAGRRPPRRVASLVLQHHNDEEFPQHFGQNSAFGGAGDTRVASPAPGCAGSRARLRKFRRLQRQKEMPPQRPKPPAMRLDSSAVGLKAKLSRSPLPAARRMASS